MDETDIKKLFMQAASDACTLPEDALKVFSALVETTLCYRDRMKERHTTVTVEDVREALDLLGIAMRTGSLPQTGNTLRLMLVKLWLDELKPYR